MKVEITTPFYDGPSFEARSIRYFNITDGKLTVIARNYDWNFVEITSVDWTDYGVENNVRYYGINTGTWTIIKEADEPNWEALEGNTAEIVPEDYLKGARELESNIIPTPLVLLKDTEDGDD